MQMLESNDMIDDIKRLLDGDFGDDRILKDIYRACKNGEVISNYERKYVRDLVGRYLQDGTGRAVGKTARGGDGTVGRDDYGYDDNDNDWDGAGDDSIPDVALHIEDDNDAAARGRGSFGLRRKKMSDDGSVRLLASARKRGRPGSKKKKITVLVAVAATLLLLAAGAASVSMMPAEDDEPDLGADNDNSTQVPTQDPGTAPVLGEFYVRTDLAMYLIGDFVSISGWSGEPAAPVSLTITSPQGVIVWSESVMAKPDGSYSTLVIAGGSSHWDAGGTFEVRAEAGGDSAAWQFEITN